MPDTNHPKRVTPVSSEALLALLETLPGALFVVDDDVTVVYANASAQAMLGATRENICGQSLWCCAPQLVSTSLYQAVLKARQTRKRTDVEYCSPVTQTWLHAQISLTGMGIAVLFQENMEPTQFHDTLRQSEQRYRDVLESISDWVVILTPEGLVLDIIQRPLADAYIRREEMVGKAFTETPWWSSALPAQQQLRAAIEQASRGEIVHFEARIHPQEGWYLDLAVTMTPHLDADRHIEYLIYAGLDITARKRAEAETHALIDALPQLVWAGRPDGYIDLYSQRWCDYTGMTIQQAQDDGWVQCTHPDDQQRVLAMWKHAVQAGQPYEVEQRLRHGTSGTYRWFLIQAMPLKDAQGTILKYVGTCTDIDDRKRAEQRLQESEENWHALAETMPQLVWVTRPDGLNEYKNQRWYDYTGEPKRSNAWVHLAFIHPDDRERSKALWQHALDTGDLYEHEERLRNGQTGEYRWFLTRGAPILDEAGRIVKWFGTLTDIEEQKRVEEALRESEARFRGLMESNLIGIVVTDMDGNIREANEAFLSLLGYSQDDLAAGRVQWKTLNPTENQAHVTQTLRELEATGVLQTCEREYVRKDGIRVPVQTGGTRFHRKGSPPLSIGFVLDLAARKEIERQKDLFLGMTGHELKTPLAALRGVLQLIQRRMKRVTMTEGHLSPELWAFFDGLTRSVADSIRQVDVQTRLINDLLDVSRITANTLQVERERCDLNSIVRQIVEDLRVVAPDRVLLLDVPEQTEVYVLADRDRISQVITNYVTNALRYSPVDQPIQIGLTLQENLARVWVRDQGPGLSEADQKEVWQRFHQVKGMPAQGGSGKGLGLGLSICQMLITLHQGEVGVESTPGEGSTFWFTLQTIPTFLESEVPLL